MLRRAYIIPSQLPWGIAVGKAGTVGQVDTGAVLLDFRQPLGRRPPDVVSTVYPTDLDGNDQPCKSFKARWPFIRWKLVTGHLGKIIRVPGSTAHNAALLVSLASPASRNGYGLQCYSR